LPGLKRALFFKLLNKPPLFHQYKYFITMAMMPGMDPEQMAQLVAEMTGKMVAGQLQQEEDHLDGMLNKLENMDSDDMDKLREARKRRMIKEAQRKQVLRSQGHGEYRELSSEKEFFKEIKQAPAAVVHFYRPATFRCAIIDKHMSRCAQKYVECKFVKINAEKSPYLCEKLHVWCLPSLVLIIDGKTEYTCVGMNDFGGHDDFSNEAFEYVLGGKGMFNYKGEDPSEVEGGPRGTNVNRKQKSSIRQREDSDSDLSD